MDSAKNTLVFFVNGKKIQDRCVNPEVTLLQYLRQKLRLCGTKLGCGEGGCGACTVMVSKYDREDNKEIHIPVNACLTPVCTMHGLAVTTVEGIGSTKSRLHPVQERIAKAHGSQCGFCTPGFVMSMYTLLRQIRKPNFEDMEEALQGNLCRCTGYRPIAEGFKTFLEPWEEVRNGNSFNKINGSNQVCALGDKCCKMNGSSKNGISEVLEQEERLFDDEKFTPYHPTQEPIFPPELKLSSQYDTQYLVINGTNVTWYRPTLFEQLLDLKHRHPHARIIVGNTEVGVETKFKRMFYPVLIHPCAVKELNVMEETDTGVRIGASVTLTDMQTFLKEQIAKQPAEKSRIFSAIVNMLFWFAGKQIRSVGAIGGNIMTGSPISDMLPILMASRVELEVNHKTNGRKIIILDENFFTGYRKTVIQPDEILEAIHIPFSNENQYFQAYKQARRREDDIAIGNIAANVTFEHNTNIISKIYLAFGGMSFKTVTAPKTEQKLKGKSWTKSTLNEACTSLIEDLPLDPSAPGGMILYRKSLALSLFKKAFIAISKDLLKRSIKNDIDVEELDAADIFSHVQQKSSQYFTVAREEGLYDSVRKPIVHMSAFKQAAGEAVYCDDIPFFENELGFAYVLSTKPHARIISIDSSKALKVPGVHGLVDSTDLGKGRNVWGCVVYDEKVFHDDIVTSQGQIIAGVVADDQEIARKAAQLVKVEYEDLSPVIVTIEDAIEKQSFFLEHYRYMQRGGDIEKVFKAAGHILEGQCRVGGQEHFYFETQGLIVVPKGEDDEMEIYSSTQNPTELQQLVAEVLGVQQNKISCQVKRLGGGFGGKETKAAGVALPVAVAARKFGRPIRCILDRDEDMLISGGRNPCLMKYRVAFDKCGRILGCQADIYLNAGHSLDLSRGVLERALSHFENAYHIPVCKVSGYLCKTNLTSNTAFRGFGGPQGMFLAESMIQHISEYLNIDRLQVSEINLYRNGQYTPYNQLLENCTADNCWKECIKMADYYKRKENVLKFNRQHRYKKRGICVVPTKFGIAFGATFLNQAGALVNIYVDGSVLLHHAGIEMGQGLYTKMMQVASTALKIPLEKIHTKGYNTDVVPNTSPTAASTGSDLNGMAILDACNKLNARLKPYKKSNPNGKWEDWIRSAYRDRVNLSAKGFYKIPEVGYDWATNQGRLYNYFTYGAACTEVEIDTLTGDHKVLRSDVAMDLGQSLNPAIDVGQVEGAFMQGYGLFVLEELVYSPTGTLFTRGPGTYKIPGLGDIPAEFNVALLKGQTNPRAVYSSKAVGEPPLFLASSALFAIKDAILAARQQNGTSSFFTLDAPATVAKIRMACVDNITSKFEEPAPGSFKPWNVRV